MCFAQSELDPSEPGYVDWRTVAASTSQNGAHPPRSGRPRKPRKPPGAQGIVTFNYNFRQLNIIFLPKFIPVSCEQCSGSMTSDKKVQKKSQNSRNQGYSYNFCLMIEGSGSGSIPLTSGSGSGRPKNMWIPWIRIRIRIGSGTLPVNGTGNILNTGNKLNGIPTDRNFIEFCNFFRKRL